MVIIFTNSFDATTDLLIPRLNGLDVFRFNLDLIDRYKIALNSGGWEVSDGFGRVATSDRVLVAYWRKPFTIPFELPFLTDESEYNFCHAELRYVLNHIIEGLRAAAKFVLAQPNAERRFSKIQQLDTAAKFFEVPFWSFCFNYALPEATHARYIGKSLSGTEVSAESVLYTTEVRPEQVNPRYPWFFQRLVDGAFDLTVLYIRGETWALSQPVQRGTAVIDWRSRPDSNWTPYILTEGFKNSVHAYMIEAGLDYGRLDFAIDHAGVIWFLEVNPNGQFAWMDLDGGNGILEAVISAISNAYHNRST